MPGQDCVPSLRIFRCFLVMTKLFVFCPFQHGLTPLHQGAQQGHVGIVNTLLAHNADPNEKANVSIAEEPSSSGSWSDAKDMRGVRVVGQRGGCLKDKKDGGRFL